MKHETRTMHIFAGHGGGLLADLILGHKPVVAVEWDGYACQVLRERAADGWFPGLRVWAGDVRLFDPSEYTGVVDCIHAGFPCQDISVAGKQAGVHEGTRSGLYREVLRIAGVVRPKQLFLENVSAILSNGLGTVLGDLAALGYDTRWLCIRASDVGAPHHRDRWFLLANANVQHGQRWSQSQQPQRDSRKTWVEHSWSSGNVADTDNKRCQERNPAGITKRPGRNGRCFDAARGASWWEAESLVGRVADGVSNRVHRLKGLGNAQCPIQAATAFCLLGGQKGGF